MNHCLVSDSISSEHGFSVSSLISVSFTYVYGALTTRGRHTQKGVSPALTLNRDAEASLFSHASLRGTSPSGGRGSNYFITADAFLDAGSLFSDNHRGKLVSDVRASKGVNISDADIDVVAAGFGVADIGLTVAPDTTSSDLKRPVRKWVSPALVKSVLMRVESRAPNPDLILGLVEGDKGGPISIGLGHREGVWAPPTAKMFDVLTLSSPSFGSSFGTSGRYGSEPRFPDPFNGLFVGSASAMGTSGQATDILFVPLIQSVLTGEPKGVVMLDVQPVRADLDSTTLSFDLQQGSTHPSSVPLRSEHGVSFLGFGGGDFPLIRLVARSVKRILGMSSITMKALSGRLLCRSKDEDQPVSSFPCRWLLELIFPHFRAALAYAALPVSASSDPGGSVLTVSEMHKYWGPDLVPHSLPTPTAGSLGLLLTEYASDYPDLFRCCAFLPDRMKLSWGHLRLSVYHRH